MGYIYFFAMGMLSYRFIFNVLGAITCLSFKMFTDYEIKRSFLNNVLLICLFYGAAFSAATYLAFTNFPRPHNPSSIFFAGILFFVLIVVLEKNLAKKSVSIAGIEDFQNKILVKKK